MSPETERRFVEAVLARGIARAGDPLHGVPGGCPMDNDVLREMTWDEPLGRLAFKGVRYLLVRPETLAGVRQAMEREIGAERTADCFFAGGFTGGSLSSRRCREEIGLSADETARFMCRMGGQIGWGRFDLSSLDVAKGVLVVSVRGSPFAAAHGRTDHPVCDLIRGVLAGLATIVLGGEVSASETGCQACGNAACTFEIHRKSAGS